MLIVQKYGGTSLQDTGRVRAAARRVTGLAQQGTQVVVVVSAQGNMTDMLIEKAAKLNRRGSAREMDAYLAAGEQLSAGLMAMAIGAFGYAAVSLTGAQVLHDRSVELARDHGIPIEVLSAFSGNPGTIVG